MYQSEDDEFMRYVTADRERFLAISRKRDFYSAVCVVIICLAVGAVALFALFHYKDPRQQYLEQRCKEGSTFACSRGGDGR